MPAARLQPYADHLGSALAERFSAETVASGLATAAAGTAAAAAVSAAWWCSGAAFESARAQCCSTYVVSSRSQVFAWMKVWLSVQPEFRQTTQTTAVQLAEELDKGCWPTRMAPRASSVSALRTSPRTGSGTTAHCSASRCGASGPPGTMIRRSWC